MLFDPCQGHSVSSVVKSATATAKDSVFHNVSKLGCLQDKSVRLSSTTRGIAKATLTNRSRDFWRQVDLSLES